MNSDQASTLRADLYMSFKAVLSNGQGRVLPSAMSRTDQRWAYPWRSTAERVQTIRRRKCPPDSNWRTWDYQSARSGLVIQWNWWRSTHLFCETLHVRSVTDGLYRIFQSLGRAREKETLLLVTIQRVWIEILSVLLMLSQRKAFRICVPSLRSRRLCLWKWAKVGFVILLRRVKLRLKDITAIKLDDTCSQMMR